MTRYEFYSREYRSYASDAAVFRPPDLVAVFNCGFHEYKEQAELDTWKKSLKCLAEVREQTLGSFLANFSCVLLQTVGWIFTF